MPKPVVLTHAARIDLLETEVYLAEQSEDAAAAFRGWIAQALRLIGELPQAAPIRSDTRRKDIRARTVESWLILYIDEPDAVRVLRVVRGRRDLRSLRLRD